MRSFLKNIILSFAVLTLLPVSVIAYDIDPDQGVVYVNVQNHLGEEISGTWYVHRHNIEGSIVRNGMKSYDFQTEEGYYFFEVRPVDQYEAFEITSEQTMFLNKGESISFDVTYYPDEEYMTAFLAGEIEPESEEEAADEETVEETVEESDEETVEESDEEQEEESEEEPDEEAAEESADEDLSGPITVTVIAPNTAPIIQAVTDSTVPSETGSDDSEMDLGAVPALATTGSAAFIFLFPSIAAGLYAATRKKR